jgi:translation initiation factor 2 subunit 3
MGILQNKIDLVARSDAEQQHEDIKSFTKGTVAHDSPVIPISAQLQHNIDCICEHIVKRVPLPDRQFAGPPIMMVVCSSDVNRSGTDVEDLQGGVVSGLVLRGLLRVRDKIEIRPGVVTKTPSGGFACRPILSTVVTLRAGQNDLDCAAPGGSITVGTTVDASPRRSNHSDTALRIYQ